MARRCTFAGTMVSSSRSQKWRVLHQQTCTFLKQCVDSDDCMDACIIHNNHRDNICLTIFPEEINDYKTNLVTLVMNHLKGNAPT